MNCTYCSGIDLLHVHGGNNRRDCHHRLSEDQSAFEDPKTPFDHFEDADSKYSRMYDQLTIYIYIYVLAAYTRSILQFIMDEVQYFKFLLVICKLIHIKCSM